MREDMKELVRFLQRDVPVVRRPLQDIALRLGVSEDDVLSTIRHWLEEGKIRRFGAILAHKRVGKKVNVMAVWKCHPEKLEEAGRIMAGFSEVSHCYERETFEGWEYNLFTMIHADDMERCEESVRKMSAATGLEEYKLLFTEKEFKKTSWEID
ncbi:MAG: Lrp/AsnC family transcriptional regulator [Candidatus Eiseniibacteriota bacterium]|nr:MAG: Lrp/AsnC family transcriptional regulator [Candidatus Eisenbacteria bacterium]